jgi:hypothetical protein
MRSCIASSFLTTLLAVAPCGLLGVPGCAPSEARKAPPLREPPPAQARTVRYHGWRPCLELDNGLVRATSVPQVGGRTLEFALGSYNFLFVGQRELGYALKAGVEEQSPQVGGHFARLHPEARWQLLQSRVPPGLFLGEYAAQIVATESAADSAAAVEMASPPDLATGTRIVRRVELFPASTHLRLTDTLTNVCTGPQEWGLHDLLQLKGHPRPSGILHGSDPAEGDLRLYVPLNPKSQFPGGFRPVVADDASQWRSDVSPGLLVLRYRRGFSKVTVDPNLPWVAFADAASGYVFVQMCPAPQKAVVTAGGPMSDYPFIEVQSFGPAVRLGTGQSTTLVQDWYAARCPGPVLDVTAVGVVCAPLSLLREADGRTAVAGTFGLFVVGTAAVVFRDAGGKELAKLDCGAVGPLDALVLHVPTELPAGTAEVALEVLGLDGKLVGHLGRILLGGQ